MMQLHERVRILFRIYDFRLSGREGAVLLSLHQVFNLKSTI